MDVAEELLDVDHTIDRAYVERRLDDWRSRLDRLYGDIEAWLPADWSMAAGGEVPIHEDLMLRFDVPPRMLPSRILRRFGRDAARMQPRGLWIVGANGRVDIVLPTAHWLLVDRAESFELPDWQVSPIMARRDRRRLTRDLVAQMLG